MKWNAKKIMSKYKPELNIDEDNANESQETAKQTISGPMNVVFPKIL